jgi:hypothetical protein
MSDANRIFQAFDMLKEPTVGSFLDSCIYSCIELQSNKIYVAASEDERNTFVASTLTAKGWVAKDQTRRGTSHQGKSSGELDIFVTLQNGRPFAVIEALNLDSLKTTYIDLHLHKIFGYDTVGLKQNLILIYASAVRFDDLWKKYCSHIKQVDYLYPLLHSTEVDDLSFCDMRLAKATHVREEVETSLFHLMVNMNRAG